MTEGNSDKITDMLSELGLCTPPYTFSKKLTVEDVAAHLCLSRAYLRNIFHQYNGMSPQQYLVNLRVERAKELLRIGTFSVSSIAHSVGFSDVLVFSKFFKNHTGMSPSEYRKERL